MKDVCKYNLFKGVSTVLTIGTPITTLLLQGDFFRHRSDTSVSAAAVIAILISLLFCKDKLFENFKMPPVAVVCLILYILISIIQSIIVPIKNVCFITMFITGADECTFKRVYKNVERTLPKQTENYKHIGFIFTTTKKLKGGDN